MNPEIGLQLYSVRSSLQKDYLGTLEKVAAIGYRNLELITTITPHGLAFGEMSAAQLRSRMDHLGLQAFSCHFMPTPDLPLDAVLADLHILGVTSLVCAFALFNNAQDAASFISSLNHLAETCRKQGVQLYYHNHFQEFQVLGEKSIFEMMIEQFDRDLVKFELDTYWAARGGQDPIYWLKKLGPRCDLVHQKDLPTGTSPVNVFEKIGYDDPITFAAFDFLQDANQFTEIGEGCLNIPAIMAAARKHNRARYIIVEQDLSHREEIESIAVSYANLNRILSAS